MSTTVESDIAANNISNVAYSVYTLPKMLGYRQARFSNETPAKFVLTQASFVGNQVMVDRYTLLHKVR
jgi:hypothetical protein